MLLAYPNVNVSQGMTRLVFRISKGRTGLPYSIMVFDEEGQSFVLGRFLAIEGACDALDAMLVSFAAIGYDVDSIIDTGGDND